MTFVPTDRSVNLAILDLLGSLAQKLTGEHPLVCLEDGAGNVLHVTLGVGSIQWFSDPQKAKCAIHNEHWFASRMKKGSATDQVA
jgi:hypothetical protein